MFMFLSPQLYRFLARRSTAPFNKVVLRRLFMSRTHRPPISVSRMVSFINLSLCCVFNLLQNQIATINSIEWQSNSQIQRPKRATVQVGGQLQLVLLLMPVALQCFIVLFFYTSLLKHSSYDSLLTVDSYVMVNFLSDDLVPFQWAGDLSTSYVASWTCPSWGGRQPSNLRALGH